MTSAGQNEELTRATDALFFAIRRARSVAADREAGLSLPQLTLLEPLIEEAELSVGALAASAGVSVPTATRMLQQLEGKGVVTRRRSATDERRVLVSLTEDGVTRLHRLRARRAERQARTFAALTPAERDTLTVLLPRLATLIEETG